MSFIHDVIKIKMVREGYLPNYPPHLISDEEMCDAFLPYPDGEIDAEDAWEEFKNFKGICWFKDKYPLLNDSMELQYRALVEDIAYYIKQFKASLDDKRKLPDWIYSYMLGVTLSVHSNIHDLHDMFVALDVDNIDDVFTPEAQAACYIVSFNWLQKYPDVDLTHRHPTLFGEPHVLKSLRVQPLR